MKYLRWISAALAAPLFLAGQAMADFTYSTAITPPTLGMATFGTNSSITFAPVSTSLPQTPLPGTGVGVEISQISIASTKSPGVDTTGSPGVFFTDTITIMPTTGGSGTLTVSGWIKIFANSNAQASLFTYDPGASSTSTVINGVTYAYLPSTLGYSQPTVNVPNSGGLSVNITAVPEPASVAMLGVGGLLLVAPRLRRHVRRIARSERA